MAGRRALVVDESLANRIAFGRLLEWMGIEVVQATDGAEAIKVYEEDPSFDIVVIGTTQTGVDSVTVAKLIRQFQLAKRPYIVGLGTSSEFSDRALKAGMDTFMVRPGGHAQVMDSPKGGAAFRSIPGGRQ